MNADKKRKSDNQGCQSQENYPDCAECDGWRIRTAEWMLDGREFRGSARVILNPQTATSGAMFLRMTVF
jgi:hypothetical protein